MNKKRIISASIFCLFTYIFCYRVNTFVIPDIEKIGSDPEILSMDPDYLIPNNKVKLYGKNFFTYPKTANILKINGKKIRIDSVSENTIEFTVPKLKISEAKIELYTSYLGFKSKSTFYPKDNNENIFITFAPPLVNSIDKNNVKSNDEILLFGEFKINCRLFLKIQGEETEGRVISDNSATVKLPPKLPYGPFIANVFYKKIVFEASEERLYNSALSNDLLFYNTELGPPAFYKINVSNNIFTSPVNDNSYIKAELYFKNGEKIDVTNFSAFKLIKNDGVLDYDENKKSFKVIKRGEAVIKAEFIWEPGNIKLEDTIKIVSDLPVSPEFHELVIDEIFPFASGFFPETDANMDSFARLNDEFIEFYNLTEKKLDISKCELHVNEDKDPILIFPENTFVEPFSYFVVFGESAHDGNFNLSNNGSIIEFLCDGKTIDYVAYPKGKNGNPSWQRNSTLDGFKSHPGSLFSPGLPPPAIAVVNPLVNETSLETNNTPILGIDNLNTEEVSTNNSSAENETIPQNNLLTISTSPSSLLINEFSPYLVTVQANYENGETKDVTSISAYEVIGTQNIINISNQGIINPVSNGSVKLQISFEDKKIEIEVVVKLISNVQPKELIINEILASPSEDVNNDSVYKSDEDEFVEVVNISGKETDLGGLIVSDGAKQRYTIPFGTKLQNLEPLIIFGGGKESNSFANIKIIYIGGEGLGLNNTGSEKVAITKSDGVIIDSIDFNNNNIKGISLNRTEDLKFTNLVLHSVLSTKKYSPGTNVNGLSFKELKESSFSTSSSSSGN